MNESTLQIMARINALQLEIPYSCRRKVDNLVRKGVPIIRDRVRNLMRHMGLRTIYRTRQPD